MGLTVLNPGLFSTVQDLGRPGFRAFGVPLGGVFDHGSASLANALLGNSLDSAVVELTLIGGRFEARFQLALALAGSPMTATVESKTGRVTPLAIPSSFSLAEGERLHLGNAASGARTYLAVSGGWQTPLILGSRSNETPLRAGDVLPCASGWTPIRRPKSDLPESAPSRSISLRFVDGPDASLLVESVFRPDDIYQVDPLSNRVGLRLDGPSLPIPGDLNRLSTPVSPGTIQVAGDRPLLLGVACGTMGGYPQIGQVVSADLDRIAQARPGDLLRFARISLGEARRLDRETRAARASRCARIAAAASDRLSGPEPA